MQAPLLPSTAEEILNALIQKGLRRSVRVLRPPPLEILNALIQKGLRRCFVSAQFSYEGNTECPDSKGIKTSLRCGLRLEPKKY